MPTLTERPVLIDADELAARMVSADRPPRILDVRWKLGDPHGREQHLAGHIPGAVYVDLATELARPGGDPAEGRHPLPDADDFQAAARRWGLDDDTAVVVYDDVGATSAARAWWLLRHAGLDDVRILDGGLGAWRSAGHRLETGPVAVAPGTITVTLGSLPVATIDHVAASGDRRPVLVDARAAERYRGEVEPVDPKAGHIPGAISLPTTGNLDTDGRFLPPAAIRERFDAALRGAGHDRPDGPVVAYCGSGVTAAHEIAALATAGIEAVLFPGSWSAWSNQDRPVASGPEPGSST